MQTNDANPTRRPPAWLILLLPLVMSAMLSTYWSRAGVVELSFSEFQRLVEAGEVEDVTVTPTQIRGGLKSERDGRSRFVTVRVDEPIAGSLDSAGVDYRGRPDSSGFSRFLGFVFPFVLLAAFWIWMSRRMMGGSGPGAGLFSVGKSRAKIYVEDDTRVSFDHVAGVDEAKDELREVVSFLREPVSFGRLGARMPRGLLLVGPPGTGKTLLARAVAGEAGVPFFSISGSEFVEMFVGVGAARVRDLFQQARAKAPCIVFIDELDALGRARGASGIGGGHDEKEQTLNQLLVELDGFDATSGVVLLGATNRPEVLDPALLRAGRFDRQILVDRPDRSGRAEILQVHSRQIRIAPEAGLEEVAALTPGFTGADLANLVNEAALLATRRGAARVQLADFTAAIERIVAGAEKRSRLLNPKEREVVAHHEMGHTLVALSIPGADPVHKVSIVPRGLGALGYTLQRPSEDRFLSTRQELEDRLCVLLGGRAAEKLVYDHVSTGAADDIARATEIARDMVTRFGMMESLGNVVYVEDRPQFLGVAGSSPRAYSPETAREIDEAVRGLVDGALARAEGVLGSNFGLLTRMAELLLEKETLTESDLEPCVEALQAPAEAA